MEKWFTGGYDFRDQSKKGPRMGQKVSRRNMSDKTQELPNPIAETINWCRFNRPDCVEHLERIHQTEGTQALLLLISLGFAAGRAYQAAPAHDQVPRFDKSPYGP